MNTNHKKIRQRLFEAFKELRKKGYIARANFMCCSKCASAVLWRELNISTKIGSVYWSQRDENHFLKIGEVYIGFESSIGTPEVDVLIGKYIVSTLISFGLDVEWDENPNTRILVKGLRGGVR